MITIEISENREKQELKIEINRKQETKLEKYVANEISKYIDKLITKNIK